MYKDLTVDDFKEFFTRNFPYLPVYDESKTYFEGDEVYLEPNFYTSLQDNNTYPLDDAEYWQITSDKLSNYVLDSDIEKARREAMTTFNIALAGADDEIVFMYLWAFYLAYDLSLANGGAFGAITFPVTSQTVGSVSESYYIPDSYINDPILGFYARNGFGLKYLNMVYPQLIGNVGVVAGWSLP